MTNVPTSLHTSITLALHHCFHQDGGLDNDIGQAHLHSETITEEPHSHAF